MQPIPTEQKLVNNCQKPEDGTNFSTGLVKRKGERERENTTHASLFQCLASTTEMINFNFQPLTLDIDNISEKPKQMPEGILTLA